MLAANTAEIQRYAHDRLLAPIDVSRIPNRRRQLPNFQQLATIGGLVQDGATYAIPFTYSSMGLIYDRKQVPAAPRSMLELSREAASAFSARNRAEAGAARWCLFSAAHDKCLGQSGDGVMAKTAGGRPPRPREGPDTSPPR